MRVFPPLPTSYRMRARWVFPVAQPPIEDGVIAIDDGKIVGLGSGPDSEAIDLGDVAIIPGLVNAHTHLEFSYLVEPLQPTKPFAAWIRAVIASRMESHQHRESAIARGITISQQKGTTCLGEIATSADSMAQLNDREFSSVAFREVLGLDASQFETQRSVVETHLQEASRDGESACIAGLSPHAPYSVHPELLCWTIDRAAEANVPVAMHLAETREELELLEYGTGPLVDMLQELSVWKEDVIPSGTTIDSYLEQLARLERALVVHGNYLTDDQIEFLAERPQFSVIYCPRTHAYFGHSEHPWQQLLDRGINVALGTDSLASNPDLSVWRELLFLRRRFPAVRSEALLRMATVNGTQALGFGDRFGTIATDRTANLAIVALEETAGATPYDRLFHPAGFVVATMHDGQWVHVGMGTEGPEVREPRRRTST